MRGKAHQRNNYKGAATNAGVFTLQGRCFATFAALVAGFARRVGVDPYSACKLEHAPNQEAEWKRTLGGGPDRLLIQDGLPVWVRATAPGFPLGDSAHSIQDRT